MIWILVVSQFLMGFPTNANIEQNHCHLIEEYKHFQTAMDEYKQFQITMDTYMASSDGICKGVFYNYSDCASILKEYPKAEDGVYRIKPSDEQGSFKAYCDMTQHGGGWLVIQRRVDGLEDFYRTWFEYMDGFGNLTGEFWLGNEKIHRLTDQTTYELRVDVTFMDGKTAYGHYKNFRLSNMSNFYRLAVSGYSGDKGDYLDGHNGMRFSAKNLDLDTHKSMNCAVSFHGAWWYKVCHESNLNGIYNNTSTKGMRWAGRTCLHTSMKIRPLRKIQ